MLTYSLLTDVLPLENKSLNLKINGVNIQEVSTVKYLGVTFDSNLTWKNHVDELCLKLSKTVGIFSKLRYYVNVDTLIMLYYSLVYPFLTYGIQVWGLTYPTYLTSNYFAKKESSE